MNILNKQVDSIYDRQKNLYSKYPHYSQQNAESYMRTRKNHSNIWKGCIGYHKRRKENSYIVHFSDSAMVSRAVARGYVTVNGKEVELTEDTKQQLLKTDKEKCCERKGISGLVDSFSQLYFTINLEEIFYFNNKNAVFMAFGFRKRLFDIKA